MGIRRSLRLQSRTEGIIENARHTTKKNKLPRKRKVKVKSNTKTISCTAPRRSLRIKKRNSYYTLEGEQSANEHSKAQILNDVKIEPCEVKLEQIDMLIEKLNIGSQEPKDHKENQMPIDREGKKDKTDIVKAVENEQRGKDSANEQTNETDESNVEETNDASSNEEANPTDIDIKQMEEEALKKEREMSEEKAETAKKIMEMLNQYKIENEIDFDEINSISHTFQEETVVDTSWDKEVVPDCYKEKIINNVLFNNTNAYNFKSCFKDRASLTAAFDRHSGQVSNETYPYDIQETPEAEKVKRFYRKNITDPSLHSWYQYNLASSKRFSKQETEELITSRPYIERYLLL